MIGPAQLFASVRHRCAAPVGLSSPAMRRASGYQCHGESLGAAGCRCSPESRPATEAGSDNFRVMLKLERHYCDRDCDTAPMLLAGPGPRSCPSRGGRASRLPAADAARDGRRAAGRRLPVPRRQPCYGRYRRRRRPNRKVWRQLAVRPNLNTGTDKQDSESAPGHGSEIAVRPWRAGIRVAA